MWGYVKKTLPAQRKFVIYVTCETEFTQLQRQSHSGRALSNQGQNRTLLGSECAHMRLIAKDENSESYFRH